MMIMMIMMIKMIKMMITIVIIVADVPAVSIYLRLNDEEHGLAGQGLFRVNDLAKGG